MPVLNLMRAEIRRVAEPGVEAANEPVAAVKPAFAINDPEGFPGVQGALMQMERKLVATERSNEAVLSRASSLASKLNAERLVNGLPPLILESVKKEEPVSSGRAAAMASALDGYANTPPNESEHLRAFESTNREIIEAQRAFSDRWSSVQDFASNHRDDFDPAQFRAAIESTGRTVEEYDADVDHIQTLSQQSAGHLDKLTDHLSAYRRKNGPNDAVEETAERVQDSLHDLAAGGAVPQAKDGHLVDDIVEKLREMIARVIEFLRNLFSKEAKPA